jgi:hypothetical protein
MSPLQKLGNMLITVINAPLLQFAERLLTPPCAFILVTELKRFYVHGGTVFTNPKPTVPGMSGNSITQAWCDTQKAVFNEKVYPFSEFGGMVSMGKGTRLGMVLVIGL